MRARPYADAPYGRHSWHAPPYACHIGPMSATLPQPSGIVATFAQLLSSTRRAARLARLSPPPSSAPGSCHPT